MDSLEINKQYKEEKKLNKVKQKPKQIKRTPIKNKPKTKGTTKTKVVKKKTKTKTRGQIVKDLDNIFSRFIRLRDADIKGMCTCITCGEVSYWKKIQCGHFISRGNYKYRRDEENCYSQDVACNIYKSGNYIAYTLKMIDMFGEDKVKEMQEDKELVKISTPGLREKIEYYKEKVKELMYKDVENNIKQGIENKEELYKFDGYDYYTVDR